MYCYGYMPDNNPQELPEWNEANLEQVISNLYREIETDQGLRQRLMNEPFEALSSRIAIPESYRGGIFLSEKGRDAMMLYVPAAGAATTEALAEGTSEESPQKNYQVLCTPWIPW